MAKVSTLRKRADFVFLREHGKRVMTQGFVLQYALVESDAGLVVGYTASGKAVGGAVQRNRAKRRLRAVVAETLKGREVRGGMWLNVVAKKAVLEMDYSYLRKDMAKALAEAGVWMA